MVLIHIPSPVLKPILNNVRVRPQPDSSRKRADLGFAVGLQINLVQAVSLSRPHFFSPSFVLQASREGEPEAVPGGRRPGVSKAGAISVSRLRASTRRPSFPALLRRRAGRPPRKTSEWATRHDRLSSGLEREGSQARSGSTGPRQGSGCDGEKPSSGSSREPRPPQPARGAGSPTRPSIPDPRPGPGPGAPAPPPPLVAEAEALPRVRSGSSR